MEFYNNKNGFKIEYLFSYLVLTHSIFQNKLLARFYLWVSGDCEAGSSSGFSVLLQHDHDGEYLDW